MDVDLKFKHPFTSIISGPTGSGKTTFCVKFLENLDNQCAETEFSGGISCYSEKTAVPFKELVNLKKNIHNQEGLPDNFGDAQGKPSLLIMDDLLNHVYSEAVCDLFTKGSHHRNVSVC
jgi:DNA replication protein DnaC